jgi:hypothetical protein
MVEGTLLVLELASLWGKASLPEQIVQEIRHNLDILTSRYRNPEVKWQVGWRCSCAV